MNEEERTLHLLLGCRACTYKALRRKSPHAFCPECGTTVTEDHPTYPDPGCPCEAMIVEP